MNSQFSFIYLLNICNVLQNLNDNLIILKLILLLQRKSFKES